MYNDFSGLAQLRADASRDAPGTAKDVARQFESLFVQMMIKSMRTAGQVLGEKKDTSYQDMFDKQIAIELTREKGIGLADMMLSQLSISEAQAAETKQPAADTGGVK